MTTYYYHATHIDFVPNIMERGLLRGRHRDSGESGTLLFPTAEQALAYGDRAHGDFVRLVAVPLHAFGIIAPDKVPSVTGLGGYLTRDDIAPEHLSLVTRPRRRAVAAQVGLPRSADDILLREGFVRSREAQAGALLSYVRDLDGSSMEFRIEDRETANLYLHEGGQTVLLRSWSIDNDSYMAVMGKMASFADGIEAYRAVQREYGNDRGMTP
jgi:hypothetical protein